MSTFTFLVIKCLKLFFVKYYNVNFSFYFYIVKLKCLVQSRSFKFNKIILIYPKYLKVKKIKYEQCKFQNLINFPSFKLRNVFLF